MSLSNHKIPEKGRLGAEIIKLLVYFWSSFMAFAAYIARLCDSYIKTNIKLTYLYLIKIKTVLQWNPSIADTMVLLLGVRIIEASVFWRLLVYFW